MTIPNTPIALQLYTLRAYGPLERGLALAAEAGYDGVETLGGHGLAAAELRARLEHHGLALCSSHVAPDALLNDLDSVLRFHVALGNGVLVLPWLPQELRPRAAEGWLELGRRLGELARRVAEAGLRLLYHNHDFELAEVGGKYALELLVAGADEAAPGCLGLEPDLAWAARAGAEPTWPLERYAGRVPRLHVKDLAKDPAPAGQVAEEGGWTDVGRGTLDWPALLAAARAAGTEWLVVEHDEPKDPAASVRRSLAYLREQVLG